MFNDIIKSVKVECHNCQKEIIITLKKAETEDIIKNRKYYCGKCAMILIESGIF